MAYVQRSKMSVRIYRDSYARAACSMSEERDYYYKSSHTSISEEGSALRRNLIYPISPVTFSLTSSSQPR